MSVKPAEVSISASGSVDLAPPPERAFEWLIDARRQGEWLGDAVEWLPTDRSQLRVGYRGTELVKMPQGVPPKIVEVPTEVELTAYEPPSLFESTSSNESVTIKTAYRFAAEGSGTRLEAGVETTYRGQTGELAARVEDAMRQMQQQGIEASLQRLKALVERED